MAGHLIFLLAILSAAAPWPAAAMLEPHLVFPQSGKLKILQVADVHYSTGKTAICQDIPEEELKYCSDLNSTAFLVRLLNHEKPDLVVFTGDQLRGGLCLDKKWSMWKLFAPVIKRKIPWAAVLGNHDQEGDGMNRRQQMEYMSRMPYSLSRVNPPGVEIDGFGNYNLEILGRDGKAVLNLYFLDSGDNQKYAGIDSYDFIRNSQIQWYKELSRQIQRKYINETLPARQFAAPALAFFHIPLREFGEITNSTNATSSDNFFDEHPPMSSGGWREGPSSSTYNAGMFGTFQELMDVKAVFVGHDHLNDFCVRYKFIQLCYAGGFGYGDAYSRIGHKRRSRVISVNLNETTGEVQSIETWKRLDDHTLSKIDEEFLWTYDDNYGPDDGLGDLGDLLPIPASPPPSP